MGILVRLHHKAGMVLLLSFQTPLPTYVHVLGELELYHLPQELRIIVDALAVVRRLHTRRRQHY